MAGRPSQLKNCFTILLGGIGLVACACEVWKHVVIRRSVARSKPASRRCTVSILQPVTKGTIRLQKHLQSRIGDELILAGDEADGESRRIADKVFSSNSKYQYLSLPPAADGGPAIKTAKMRSALEKASGEIVLFVDDDILLPPEAADVSAMILEDPRNGAVFGVPFSGCYEGLWSSLMSAFVNRYAFPSYLPLASLLPVYSVTGHWYAVRRADMLKVADYVLEENRLDDDHAIGRVLRSRGLQLVQVPLVHVVENYLPDARSFHRQMKRWFVFVREMMTPHLTRREQVTSSTLALPESILPLLAIGAAALRSPRLGALVILLLASGVEHACFAAHQAGRKIPLLGFLLTPIVSLFAPLYVAGILSLANNRIWWRGRELLVRRDGKVVL